MTDQTTDEGATLSVGELRERMAKARAREHPCSIVAIYLGREQYTSLLHDLDILPAIRPTLASDIKFDGVPLYRVDARDHLHVAVERRS